MPPSETLDLGDYFTGLMTVVMRASPGPFSVSRAAGDWYEVSALAGAARPIATFARRTDAELFVRALSDLRAGVAALVETVGVHRDTGAGVCAQDGQKVPCLTRRVLIAQLMPPAEAS
jgi:hypothetical protein